MRLWTVLALMAAFFASVHAQEALLALAKHMPKCSLACFTKELPKSSCATNLTPECLCTNEALNAAVAVCAKKTCTVYELLQTKNVSNNACGVPVRYKGTKFTVIGIVGAVLAIVAYILRMAASLGKSGRQMGWDDATMGLVVLLAIPPTVFAPILVHNGLGRDIWTLQPQQISNILKYYFLGEIFYVVALGVSKMSILFFYLRVFPSKRFRMVTYVVMGLSLGYAVAFFFATLFQFGIFVIVVSVIRLESLIHFANTQNISWDYVEAGYWSLIEVDVSIICGCMPAHRFLIAKAWPRIRSSFGSSKGLSSNDSSLNGSKFGGGSKTGGSTPGKSMRISVKSKSHDEGDFIPLVNVDNASTSAASAKGMQSEKRNSPGWIMQTSSVDISHSNALATEHAPGQAHNWTLGRPASNKEHV